MSHLDTSERFFLSYLFIGLMVFADSPGKVYLYCEKEM